MQSNIGNTYVNMYLLLILYLKSYLLIGKQIALHYYRMIYVNHFYLN